MASNTHDDACELIEVGIGVGIQTGPCFCHYRKLEREFSVAQERIKMLETGTRYECREPQEVQDDYGNAALKEKSE